MTIWCMPIACWIPGATSTHSDYVLRIGFPLQQMVAWTHTYVASLVSGLKVTT